MTNLGGYYTSYKYAELPCHSFFMYLNHVNQ